MVQVSKGLKQRNNIVVNTGFHNNVDVHSVWNTYHWKHLTSNLTLMYLLGNVCCQQIHRNQICLWILICTLLWGLIIFYFDIIFGQHIQIHWKSNIKIEFNLGYFQWKLSTSFSYPLDSFNKVLTVLVAQVVGYGPTDWEVSSSNLHWKLCSSSFLFCLCFTSSGEVSPWL